MTMMVMDEPNLLSFRPSAWTPRRKKGSCFATNRSDYSDAVVRHVVVKYWCQKKVHI